jgi:hypothetical protein
MARLKTENIDLFEDTRELTAEEENRLFYGE